MANTLIEMLYPMYNTFDIFSKMKYDSAYSMSIMNAIDPENPYKDQLKEKFNELRIEADRNAVILHGFINRYNSNTISENDVLKIVSIIKDLMPVVMEIEASFKYASDKTYENRYKRYMSFKRKLSRITTIRQTVEAYNSMLIDFDEIDTLMKEFPSGVIMFDATYDNETFNNNVDIVFLKLITMLTKLKDGGVQWAEMLLEKSILEPEHDDTTHSDTSSESIINELDQA